MAKKDKRVFAKDSFDTYLSKKDHISASACKDFLKSPRYYHYVTFEKPKDPLDKKKRHFPIGSAIHEKVMEPELFDEHFIVEPKIDARTKDGKIKLKEYEERSAGKTVLFSDEMELVNHVAINARKDRELYEYISNSHKEISCYTVDPITGLKLKVRPDLLWPERSLVTDLKSTVESSKKSFTGDIYKFGYGISNALYVDVLKMENYVFAACEKTAPFQTTLFMLQDEKVEFGRQQYRMALDLMKFCRTNKYYPDYADFEILKEQYLLDVENVQTENFKDEYFETIKTQSRIIII